MPRRARSVDKHALQPDPRFNSIKYSKFINYMMKGGKKSVAQKIFYTALDNVEKSIKGKEDYKGKDSVEMFELALKNVSPLMEIKGRRIGGSNYQVPMEVLEPRRTTLGMRWMIKAARARKGAPMAERLASEIMDAYNKLGNAYKKREDTHRMAEANKAFAHFARFMKKR